MGFATKSRPHQRLFATASLMVLTALTGPAHAQEDSSPRLAIPSYASPASAQWTQWQSLGSPVVGIMVLNRNNGDDVSVDPAWVRSVKSAQASGILVLGYVHTGYAHRNPDEILAKIDGVYTGYGVDGIFLDETPTDCGANPPGAITNLAYYQALAKFIRGKSGKHLVVMNPGTTPPDNCWMGVADVLVTFENPSLAGYQSKYIDAAWTHAYPPSRFWHLVFSVPTVAEMQQVAALAHQRGAGWLYVTDDGPDGNPWDNPATYLAAEAKAWTGIEPVLPAASRRTFIQWGGMKAPRMQIFLDTGQKGRRFSGAGTDLSPDLVIEVPGDGSVQLMRYAGSGDDWLWKPLNAHPVLSQPQPGTFRVAFDADSLGPATDFKIRFRILDHDWNPVSVSKVMTWKPN